MQQAINVAFGFDAEVAENERERIDVGDVGDTVENHRAVGQDAGGHDWEGGVFCALGGCRAAEGRTTVECDDVHVSTAEVKWEGVFGLG